MMLKRCVLDEGLGLDLLIRTGSEYPVFLHVFEIRISEILRSE